ncbi:MAG: hypothetical protein DRN78_01325 [Thermoproteota archaeon]|nr:MAG: hypothetical protein DRN78_01325 [Candidatus Korarchaeota archaeon]
MTVQRRVSLGLDIGGTNIDVALVDADDGSVSYYGKFSRHTYTVAEALKIEPVRRYVESARRVMLSTSRVLNTFLETKLPSTSLVLAPGPGLPPPRSLAEECIVIEGYVDPRGIVLEDVDVKEIVRALERKAMESIAIVTKFSIRNPILEQRILEAACRVMPRERIAVSHKIPFLDYRRRAATTVLTAKLKLVLHDLMRELGSWLKKLYLIKGDGGAQPLELAVENAALALGSSQASIVIGVQAVLGSVTGVIVDVGGTTIDVVPIASGESQLTTLHFRDADTYIVVPRFESIVAGGDCSIAVVDGRGRVVPRRAGVPAAFGGEQATVTDALNYALELSIGDHVRSRRVIRELARKHGVDPRDLAQGVVEDVVSKVVELVRKTGCCGPIIAAGYLGKHVAPLIAKECGVGCIVPEHYHVLNAIGAAATSFSLEVGIYYDGVDGKAVFTPSGRVIEAKKRFIDKGDILEMAREELIGIARRLDAEDLVGDIEVVHYDSFTVVKERVPQGMVAHCIIRAKPKAMIRVRR